ncbi:hypothetical protein C1645_873214 [Glomus cerebriforme]|uniref:Uncharacterized protein n=1 Tax=Glomus cerebriforme TaxID=658196 RepID=A0A397T930_9GLOM|nr:hypothetical protein C1645_873214 [Glomus cerebriforme]
MLSYVNDEQLFTINLFATFVNNNYIKTDRNDWQHSWRIGIDNAEAIGLHKSLMSPIMMMGIVYGLGSNYSSWFLPTYDRIINSEWRINWDSWIFSTSSINLLDGGIKMKKFFNEMKLNEKEKNLFNKFIIIKKINNTMIFLFKSELLKNDEMIKCFIEMFINITTFSKSKSFIFYFIEKNWIKLFRFYFIKKLFYSKKYDYDGIIYESLIENFDTFRITSLLNDSKNLKGFMIDLNKFSLKNLRLKVILKIWNGLNENDGNENGRDNNNKIIMISKL